MDFYNQEAKSFFERTVDIDMSPIYGRFTPLLSKEAHILDAGCGSGRDAKAFRSMGYKVAAVDASAELARLAEAYSGVPVRVCRFQELADQEIFDAVWACASLLHVREAELPQVFANIWQALKPGGVFYFCFKYGSGERVKDGRHFTDANEQRIESWLSELPNLTIIDMWRSDDQRQDAELGWMNALIKKI